MSGAGVELTERKLSFAEEMRALAAEKLRRAEQDMSLVTIFADEVKEAVHNSVDRDPRQTFLYLSLPLLMTFDQLAHTRAILQSKENGLIVTPSSTTKTWTVSWKKEE